MEGFFHKIKTAMLIKAMPIHVAIPGVTYGNTRIELVGGSYDSAKVRAAAITANAKRVDGQRRENAERLARICSAGSSAAFAYCSTSFLLAALLTSVHRLASCRADCGCMDYAPIWVPLARTKQRPLYESIGSPFSSASFLDFSSAASFSLSSFCRCTNTLSP